MLPTDPPHPPTHTHTCPAPPAGSPPRRRAAARWQPSAPPHRRQSRSRGSLRGAQGGGSGRRQAEEALLGRRGGLQARATAPGGWGKRRQRGRGPCMCSQAPATPHNPSRSPGAVRCSRTGCCSTDRARATSDGVRSCSAVWADTSESALGERWRERRGACRPRAAAGASPSPSRPHASRQAASLASIPACSAAAAASAAGSARA